MDPGLFWTVENKARLEVYEESDTVEEWSFQGVDVDEAEVWFMVIQLMVDRSSSNMEAGNIAKIHVSSALVRCVVRWRERRYCGRGMIG